MSDPQADEGGEPASEEPVGDDGGGRASEEPVGDEGGEPASEEPVVDDGGAPASEEPVVDDGGGRASETVVDDGAAPPPPTHSRRSLYLVLTPIVVLTAVAFVGDALAPTLINSHPVWLLLMNTRKRYLALTVNTVDPVTFFVVGVGRAILVDPLYFVIGRRYGDAGVRWLERKLGDGAAGVTMFEGWFKKAAYPMVAIAPNAIISVLAGASKMKASVFLAINLAGTIVTMIILRLFGDVFSSPLGSVLSFLRRYQLPLTVLSVVLVTFQVIAARRSGKSELESLSELERQLEEAKAEQARRDAVGGQAHDEPGGP